jgi:hypothetical protein
MGDLNTRQTSPVFELSFLEKLGHLETRLFKMRTKNNLDFRPWCLIQGIFSYEIHGAPNTHNFVK